MRRRVDGIHARRVGEAKKTKTINKSNFILNLASIIALVLAPLAFPVSTSAVHLADGLAGYWNFDDVVGVPDVTTHGNNGTYENGASRDTTKKPTVPGNVASVLLDGTNDFVNVVDIAGSELDVDNVTLSAWIYIDASAVGTRNIVRKGHFGNRVYGLDVGAPGSNKVRGFVVLGPTGGSALIASGSISLTAEAWHHVAMTYDGTNVKVYIDGVLDATSVASIGVISDNDLSVRIGGQPSGDSGGPLAFKGNIDEVRIYDRALSSGEVGALADYSEFSVDSLTPLVDYNPVGTDHTVTATIDPALSFIPVLFDIDGPNSSESDTVMTDGSGEAVFTYTGAAPGTDTISACVDSNDDGDCSDESSYLVVTKYWLEHYVTGGGVVKGSKPLWSFGGNVGYDLDGNVVGQFQIVNHTNKLACHLNSFSELAFSGTNAPAESPYAEFDTATFVGSGECNNGTPATDVNITIQDLGEPGAGLDKIEISDFPGSITTFSGPISGGNFQVHPPEIP